MTKAFPTRSAAKARPRHSRNRVTARSAIKPNRLQPYIAEKREKRSPLHSITSSAATSSLSGTVSPSAFAVLRLIASSNFTVCWTGKSAGFSPLRIRPRGAAGESKGVGNARAIADQPADLGKLAQIINCRKRVARCQPDELIAPTQKE